MEKMSYGGTYLIISQGADSAFRFKKILTADLAFLFGLNMTKSLCMREVEREMGVEAGL